MWRGALCRTEVPSALEPCALGPQPRPPPPVKQFCRGRVKDKGGAPRAVRNRPQKVDMRAAAGALPPPPPPRTALQPAVGCRSQLRAEGIAFLFCFDWCCWSPPPPPARATPLSKLRGALFLSKSLGLWCCCRKLGGGVQYCTASLLFHNASHVSGNCFTERPLTPQTRLSRRHTPFAPPSASDQPPPPHFAVHCRGSTRP